MPDTCPSCGSSEIETDSARGSQVCTRCGTVLEDNLIISEVQFAESGGTSNVVGQSVNADGSKPFSLLGPSGFHSGYTRDSRMMTIDNGRKSIAQLAASLALQTHHIDSAHRYFKLAVEHRFIQGRKTEHVVAVCLYIVCRYEKTSHMLLDFADALQVNVFTLGSVYLKLVLRLNIRGMPIIDPSLYILRFASKMDFGDRTHEVGRTALRLVGRMKRDWIQVGRRPSGICGAALLVAARMHGFHRTQKDVVAVVRVCDSTLRKRLEEFEDTPSSSLTMSEFMKIDMESEADPPAYTQSRKRARLEAQTAKEAPAIVDERAAAEMEKVMNDPSFAALNTDARAGAQAGSAVPGVAPAPISGAITVSDDGALRHGGAPPAPPAAPAATVDAGPAAPMDDETLSDLDDGEIGDFILDKDESAIKESVWKEENKAYIAAMKSKAAQAERDLENGVVKPDKKKKNKKKVREQKGTYSNATEAMQQLLAQKQYKVSPKINYAVLKVLGIAPPEDEGAAPSDEASANASSLEPVAETSTGQ